MLAVVAVPPAAPAAEPQVKTVCYAISDDDHSRYPGSPAMEVTRPVELIVVGTVRKLPGGNKKEAELVVERTLFGPRWKRLPLVDVDIPADPVTPMIYCLSYAGDGTAFKFTCGEDTRNKRIFPLEEEPAVSAMAQARTDTLILGSEMIFIGRPILEPVASQPEPGAALPEHRERFTAVRQPIVAVKVVRVVYGSGPKQGETIRIFDNGNSDLSGVVGQSFRLAEALKTRNSTRIPSQEELDRLPLGEPQLYFCRVDNDDENSKSGQGVVCSLGHSWPVAELDQIEATQKRRSLFPIRKSDKESDHNESVREITFPGSRAAAIALLGSSYEAAHTLGVRRLLMDGPPAIPEVAAAVEANLFRTQINGTKDFRQQRLLIELLSAMEGHRNDGEIVRIINHVLDRIQAGASYPPVAKPGGQLATFSLDGYRIHDFENHSLAWLVLTLTERDAARLFGTRLLKLRALSAYGWKDEIQNIADVHHIVDQLELAKFRELQANLSPVRWQAGIRADSLHSRHVYAFSPDDQYCASADSDGGRIWKTEDWSLVREIPHAGSPTDIAFSADGKFLYVAHGAKAGTICQWDWQSGQEVHRFADDDIDVGMIRLSPDGRRLLASSGRYAKKAVTVVWDAESGNVLLKTDRSSWNNVHWHPRGDYFLGQDYSGGWFRIELQPHRSERVAIRSIAATFAPGANEICTLELPPRAGGILNNDDLELSSLTFGRENRTALPTPILRRRGTDAGWTVKAEFALDFPAAYLHISSDGTTLVATDFDDVASLSVPDFRLQARGKTNFTVDPFGGTTFDRPKAFSHDANVMLVSRWIGMPELYHIREGQRLPLGRTHSGIISRAQFTDHDSRLRTISRDDAVCVWDIDSQRLLERTGVPGPAQDVRRQDRPTSFRSEDGTVVYRFKDGNRGYKYRPPADYTIEVVSAEAFSESDEADDSVPEADIALVTVDSPEKAVPQDKPGHRKLGKPAVSWHQEFPIGLVPDGRHLFIGTHMFRRDDLSLVSSYNLGGQIRQIEFSADGRRYASVNEDREMRRGIQVNVHHRESVWQRVRVHDIKTGEPLLAVELLEPRVACVALSSDGRKLAVVGDDSSVQIWSVPDAGAGAGKTDTTAK
jgi:WD40 repeat protein